MDEKELLIRVRASLQAVITPRFFETERGYQGALVAELSSRIRDLVIADEGALVEQEYQKTFRQHGLAIRPDIIIHAPFDQERHADRKQGNFAVFELKRRATEAQARGDFQSLLAMMHSLNYPIGIFVNVDSNKTYVDVAPRPPAGRLIVFAVTLRDGAVCLTEGGT